MPVVVAMLTAVVIGLGCAGVTSDGPVDGGESLPTGLSGDDVLLRVEEVGGFVHPATALTRLPSFTLYGDGRVITPDPTSGYPEPTLPTLSVRRLATADLDALVRAAIAAGVGDPGIDYGNPSVTDLPSTRVTLRTSGGERVTEVYALRVAQADSTLRRAQQAARQRLRDFIARLADAPLVPPAGEPYQPRALAALAWPYLASPDKSPRPARPWPGQALPTVQYQVAGMTCVVVTGEALATLLQEASTADELTPWTSGGGEWSVRLRPLLPDETSCEDLHA